MQGWMLSYKYEDPYQNFSRTYMKENTAYKDASESIASWADEELKNIQFQNDPERYKDRIALLYNIFRSIQDMNHKEVYELWREYADDMTPDEDVMIEDTHIVEE